MPMTVSVAEPHGLGRMVAQRRGTRRAAGSDIVLVERLYAGHRSLLLSYLSRLTPTREDAEEATQEAYLRLLDAPALDGGERRLRSYLFTTGRNVVTDLFRRRQARRAQLHVDIEALDLPSPDPDPEAAAEAQERLAILEAALSDSLPRARQAFELHFDEQLSYRHIAEALGVSRKTVERDIATVLTLCRERLGGRDTRAPETNQSI